MAVVIKQSGQIHFRKDFGGKTVSDRIILPSRDNCRIKVTKFSPKQGFCPGENVVHDTDELVYVIRGSIVLEAEGSSHHLTTNGSYFVPAHTPTTIKALLNSVLLCVFFPGTDGKLSDDD